MVVLVLMDRLVMAAGPDGTGSKDRAQDFVFLFFLIVHQLNKQMTAEGLSGEKRQAKYQYCIPQ